MDSTTSPACGDNTIIDTIRRLAEEDPNKEAFVFLDKFDERIAFTRKDFWAKCQQCAAFLKHHGIEKGDIVGNTLVNSPERLITAYGTITAGAITMNGQLLLASGEDLLHNLKTSKCKAIIVDIGKENDAAAFLDQISSIDEKTGEICYEGLPFLKIVIKLKVYSKEKDEASPRWLYALDNFKEEEMFVEEDICENDVAIVFNTSGTTGFCKLVPYTHRILHQLYQDVLLKIWLLDKDSVFYTKNALGWFGGFPHIYNANGSKNVISNYAHGIPDDMVSHMIKVFENEKCDHANLSGIEMERLLDRLEKPLPHLFKIIGVGGGPMAKFIERAIGVITKQIFVGYGGTEFGGVSVIKLDQNSTFEDYCTGPIIDPVEMKILDNNLAPVPTGQQGEIFIRSPSNASHYLNNPEKTKESFLEDGWFRTGDLGYADSKGQLFVLGRIANAIMKGSFMFYPGWLETQILKCPGIQTVAVIGVPDPILYEDVCLCVVKTSDGNLTEEAVNDFCRKLFLTSKKEEITPMPKYILFFDEFPFNSNMKLDRAALKDEACTRINSRLQ